MSGRRCNRQSAGDGWDGLAQELSTLTLLRRVIARVPRGRVITYGRVAEAAGFPGAARLTVWALQGGDELPWHRVVGAGGRIALPGAAGQEQRLRLRLEGVKFRGGRVRMDLYEWTPRRRRKRRDRPTDSRAGRGLTLAGPALANVRDVSGELVGFGPRPKPLRDLRFARRSGELEDG